MLVQNGEFSFNHITIAYNIYLYKIASSLDKLSFCMHILGHGHVDILTQNSKTISLYNFQIVSSTLSPVIHTP